MKRFLLFVGVAVAAMTASAQTKTVSIEKLETRNVQKVNMVPESMNLNSIVAAAPAVDALAGNYTQANNNYGEIIECAPVTISIEGANVKLALGKGMTVTGTYDATTGVINVGTQTCGSITDSRGTFELEMRGISELDLDNGKLLTTDELSFTVDENGSIDCDQAGYFVEISKFTAAEGTSYTDGQYDGFTWTWFADVHFMPINGVQAGFQMGKSTGDEWAEFSYPVSIEDYEYSVNVYNYANLGCLAIDVNEDGTVSVPMGQPMLDMGFTDQNDIDTYGAYLCVHGVDLTADNKMQTNTDKEVTIGTISGNTITIDEYTRISTKFDEEGRGYAQNWYADEMTITLDEGNYLLGGTLGINDVKPTLEERAKNSKTYNLMGQQVNRKEAAKGILIRDGKKFINRK